jgi:hypothetical protein
MRITQEYDMFKDLTNKMNDIFQAKRNDYGPSTEDTFKRYGAVSLLVRMRDKLNRLDNLLVTKISSSVNDERVEDTLLDLANYALITVLEMKKAELEAKGEESIDCERY